jgi:DNA polymerase III delta prime subunit
MQKNKMEISGEESLERILCHPLGRHYFLKFLVEEGSEENLLFWMETEECKLITDEHKKQKTANEIYRKYFRNNNNSSEKMNFLSKSNREDIKSTSALFMDLQSATLQHMKIHNFTKFTESPHYRKLLHRISRTH